MPNKVQIEPVHIRFTHEEKSFTYMITPQGDSIGRVKTDKGFKYYRNGRRIKNDPFAVR